MVSSDVSQVGKGAGSINVQEQLMEKTLEGHNQ